ncbi:hypothetical protein [Cohnella luojiensis]|uniref:Uncharacterized protein n=1 Tax=Cohnella luojiensis TaxID=652876 RepID=A0A4Y8LSK7_9BACL|nr:hypothetical protein [Cohnella luojiensis]TFE23733.1 hypothetical protein E2980_18025 [Cohnella luojiensis]
MMKKKLIVAMLGLALSVGTAQSAFAANEAGTSSVDSTKQAQKTEWKEATQALKIQLVVLRAEQQALTAQIKALRISNKVAHKALTQEQKAALKETLSDLAGQIKSQHSSINSIRAQKQAHWALVKVARKEGNTAAGVANLEQIISLKEQIIQAKEAILVLQQSLQAALSGSANT